MADEDGDLEERGRSIFDRLRTSLADEPSPAQVIEDPPLPEEAEPGGQGGIEDAPPEEARPSLPEELLEEEFLTVPDAYLPDPEVVDPDVPDPNVLDDDPVATPPVTGAARSHQDSSAATPGEGVGHGLAHAEPTLGDDPLQVPSPLASVDPDERAAATGSSDQTYDPGARTSDHFARPLPRVLAIANQKGGVGKTTTAVNLSAALAELGYRVLVIDLDPQGNATTGLGINPRNLESSVYDVIMHDTPLEDCIEPTSLKNLFVVPATIDLAGAEIELVPAFSRELKLRKAIEALDDDFDFTLIDCPPSLGLITINGLAAATEVVVPIQCEYYALEGLGQLLRNVTLVQGNLNPTLDVSAIILTMYDARTKLAEQVANDVRAHFGPKVCRNVVPRTVRLSEAPSFGQPIIVFDPVSRGAIAYRELAKEVSGGAPQRTG